MKIEDILRKIVVLRTWKTPSASVAKWTMEPVLPSSYNQRQPFNNRLA